MLMTMMGVGYQVIEDDKIWQKEIRPRADKPLDERLYSSRWKNPAK